MTAMGIPSTFLIGPDRMLLDRSVGYSAEVETRWKQIIEKKLKPAKKPALRPHSPDAGPNPDWRPRF